MSTEANRSIVQRFLEELINRGNLAAADELAAPDVVLHLAGVAEPVRGLEAFKQIARGFFTAFPDLHETVEDEIAEGDVVVRRVSWRGTHEGALMGLAATGKQVTVKGMRVYRLRAGKIAEEWAVDDTLGLMQQLGALPA